MSLVTTRAKLFKIKPRKKERKIQSNKERNKERNQVKWNKEIQREKGNRSNSNYANYCFDLTLKWKKYRVCCKAWNKTLGRVIGQIVQFALFKK